MKRYIPLMVLSAFILCAPHYVAHAEDEPSLHAQAVFFAAQADAYNVYCDEEAGLAQQFIDRFTEQKTVAESDILALEALRAHTQAEDVKVLQAAGLECNETRFMLAKLQVMRELKDVSYRLNGIDPATLDEPDIPALEDLMLPAAPLDIP